MTENYTRKLREASEEVIQNSILPGIRRNRGKAEAERPNAGVHILSRMSAPSDADIAALDRKLKQPLPMAGSLPERYTRGYTRKLTTKQETFLDQLLRGDTLLHAYEVAYPNAKGSKQTRANDAWYLSQHPIIVVAMEKAQREKQNHVRMDATAIRSFVLERLLYEAQHALSDASRVRSLELLGKLGDVGMFIDRKEVKHVTDSPGELKNLLVNRLKEIFDNRERTINQPPTEQGNASLRHSPDTAATDADEVSPPASPPKAAP